MKTILSKTLLLALIISCTALVFSCGKKKDEPQSASSASYSHKISLTVAPAGGAAALTDELELMKNVFGKRLFIGKYWANEINADIEHGILSVTIFVKEDFSEDKILETFGNAGYLGKNTLLLSAEDEILAGGSDLLSADVESDYVSDENQMNYLLVVVLSQSACSSLSQLESGDIVTLSSNGNEFAQAEIYDFTGESSVRLRSDSFTDYVTTKKSADFINSGELPFELDITAYSCTENS